MLWDTYRYFKSNQFVSVYLQVDDIWPDVEPEIDNIVEKRLSEILRDWDDKFKLFQSVQIDLIKTFKEEFLLLDTQLSSVETYIQNDDISLSEHGDDEMSLRRQISITDNIDTGNGLWNFNLNTLEKVALGVAAPVLVPVSVSMLLGAPLLLVWDFKKWRRRSTAQKNLEKYLQNPLDFVTIRACQTLDKVADIEIVSEYVYYQLEPARTYLENMRSTIPKLVQANRGLMDAIVHDKRTSKELEERYAGLETMIPECQEKLAGFGNLYLREYDFDANDLMVLDSSQKGKTSFYFLREPSTIIVQFQ